jgi:hypothetical protein
MLTLGKYQNKLLGRFFENTYENASHPNLDVTRTVTIPHHNHKLFVGSYRARKLRNGSDMKVRHHAPMQQLYNFVAAILYNKIGSRMICMAQDIIPDMAREYPICVA